MSSVVKGKIPENYEVPLLADGLVTVVLWIVGMFDSAVIGINQASPSTFFGWLLAATSVMLVGMWILFPANARASMPITDSGWEIGETAFMLCLTASLLVTIYASATILSASPSSGYLLWVPTLNFVLGIVGVALWVGWMA